MKCLIGEDTFTTKSGMILVHSNLTSIVLCHSFLTRSVKSDDFFLQATVKGVEACVVLKNTSNSGSGGPRFKSHPLRCFLRQGTLLYFVSLHPGVLMGTGDMLLGVTLQWTGIPSRGE